MAVNQSIHVCKPYADLVRNLDGVEVHLQRGCFGWYQRMEMPD